MLGTLQLEVMEEVWKCGNATVAEVHGELSQRRTVAYTTVLTTLRALEKRGFLRHTVEGKAHRYHARISRDEHTRESVTHLVGRLFAGSPERLMSHLLGVEQLGEDDLQRIRKLMESEEEEESP